MFTKTTHAVSQDGNVTIPCMKHDSECHGVLEYMKRLEDNIVLLSEHWSDTGECYSDSRTFRSI